VNKELIVTSNGHQTMAAILEDDQVVELSVERERQRGVVGNVYKGRVSKVLPGMQSAFVDIGL
jgi:ribonuclease G